uniref:Uncharacterized protein n=1 Tax=Anguilla anguilla TaxID=7936 RepID=A0A0E9QNH6_ANGAN
MRIAGVGRFHTQDAIQGWSSRWSCYPSDKFNCRAVSFQRRTVQCL